MGMNNLTTRGARRRTVKRLYSGIEDGPTPRDISFDENGVLAFCGTQGTNHVWYGERTEHDNSEATFRVLKLEPTKSKGVHPNPRTGKPEFGTRLSNVRYVVGDVTIPVLSHNTNLGTVLREIQSEFRHVHRARPIESGTVGNDTAVSRVYERVFL